MAVKGCEILKNRWVIVSLVVILALMGAYAAGRSGWFSNDGKDTASQPAATEEAPGGGDAGAEDGAQQAPTQGPESLQTADPAPSPELEPTPTATPTATPAPTATPTPTPTPEPTPAPLPLAGLKVGIDPGHQLKGNFDTEPVAPNSSERKAKVAAGTSGRFTGTPEHEVNLQVSLGLRDALVAQGAEVKMARETADVDISNVERAQMMNEWGADIVLRIHCNGAENSSANGIGLYVRKTGAGAEESLAYAQTIIGYMLEETGAREDGVFRRDTYSGLNWSEVPSILVEMGFMTNKEEDIKLNDPAYQQKLIDGMVKGVAACFDREMQAGMQAEAEAPGDIAPANPLGA
jgi:N-acetylmuramoyl-L-alanine amidase